MALNFLNFNQLGMTGYGSMIGGYGSNSYYANSGCGNSIFGSILGGINCLSSGYNMISGAINGGYGSALGGFVSGGYGSLIGGMFNGGCGSFLGGLTSLFTKPNGVPNFASIAGFGVGMTVLKSAGAILSEVVSNKKEHSYTTLNSEANRIASMIKSEAALLGGSKTATAALEYTIEPSYQQAIDLANENIKATETKISGLTATIAGLETELAALKAAPTEENKAIIEAKEKELNTKKAELKAEQAKIAENGDLTKKLATAQNAKEVRQKEIDDIKKTIKSLQASLESVEGVLEDKIFDKADGNPFTRISAEKFNAKFDGNRLKSDVKVDKRDLHTAVLNYKAANTEEEKELCKTQFLAIWNEIGADNIDSKFLQMSYDLIMS